MLKICGRGETVYAPERESGGAQAREGATPAVRTTLSRRGWNVDTAGSNPAALMARGRATRPGHTNFFGEWWSEYTRVSETRGRKPVQVQILSRRPISAPR